ncbi:hypothetical protein Aple_010910 [Acrocarpospora pleiomorpha]|uniref:Uncharacterized protein n=1 Tax=Acrocarpospora pleiomorpha TaxID=90975 RepID=A0A5M3XC03_9ACTN|nr:hypothetical protein [Acrocarpospora pleiomorpha]GES18196.1 hypothetical protein Aple_010910 [Acrocarpospora pleiomorpha]
MNTTATTAQIPAERILPGIGRQIVNLHRNGEFLRQVSYRGTVEQARAYAELFITHDTDPRWAELRAIVLGG